MLQRNRLAVAVIVGFLLVPAAASAQGTIAGVAKDGRTRTKAFADLANAPNFSTILAQSTTYGTTWLQPTGATSGRYIRLGLELTF